LCVRACVHACFLSMSEPVDWFSREFGMNITSLNATRTSHFFISRSQF
jgi:hypothetical protein